MAVAVIDAVVVEATPDVEMVNVAVVPPLAIWTEEGGVTAELLLVRYMTVPLSYAAGALRVTVPVAVPPPSTEVGLTLRLATTGGVTVRDVVTELELSLTEIG